jgi:hypothetical protein
MRYSEISETENQGGHLSDSQSKRHSTFSVKNLDPRLIEDPVNSLYLDLMTALESSLMNVAPVSKRRGR